MLKPSIQQFETTENFSISSTFAGFYFDLNCDRQRSKLSIKALFVCFLSITSFHAKAPHVGLLQWENVALQQNTFLSWNKVNCSKLVAFILK